MKNLVTLTALVMALLCMAGLACGESLETELLFDASQGDASRAVYAQSCNSSYGYREIVNGIGSEEMRLLYEAIDEATAAFWLSNADLTEETAVAYAYAVIDVTDLSLDAEQRGQVYHIYRMDHPLYYWLPTVYFEISSETSLHMYLTSVPEYASGEYRARLYSRITNAISQYSSYCSGATSRYTKATATLYLMAQKIDYAYNASNEPEESPWAHSIIGVFDPTYDSAVCEGYAKAYQLLMNYLGVPNVYVVGYSGGDTGNTGDWLMHAWNLIQMGDGKWYWTDPTWSDLNTDVSYGSYGEGDGYRPADIGNGNRLEELYYRCRYTYHLKGNAFLNDHGPLMPSNSGMMYLYPLPESSAAAYVPDIAGEVALEMPAQPCGTGYQPNFSLSYGVELITAGPIEYVVVQNDGLHRKVVAVYGNELMRQLKEVTIPASVTLNGVEYDVVAVNLNGIEPNVESVVIPEGVRWVFGELGYETMATRSLHIPASVEYIGQVYISQTALSEITVAEGNPYIKAVDGVLYTKDGTVLLRYPVNKAGESFALPSSVKELYANSFRWNKCLKQIDLGDTLERINVYAFGTTAQLERLEIPASVKLLPRKILSDNESVRSISISKQTAFTWDSIQGASGLEIIELEEGNPSGFLYDGALYMYTTRGISLVFYPGSRVAETLTVHEDCDYIEGYAFTGCKEIGTVKIPAGCKIDIASFFRAGIGALDIAEGNTSINYANGAIYSEDGKTLHTYLTGCRSEEFIVPDTVETIAQYAFYENPYIRRVSMSDSVTDVQAYAFSKCTALESVRLSNNIAWTRDYVTDFWFYRGIFAGDISLKTVNIPAAATHLPYYTFDGCASLEDFVLPETLHTIGDAALWGCSSMRRVYILNPDLEPADGSPNYATDWERAVLNARGNDLMYVYAARGSKVESFMQALGEERMRPAVFRDIDADLSALPASGSCGDGLVWSVSEDGRTLTVSGSGSMTDYPMYNVEPEWHRRWSESVERIVISEGVTHVGDFAFYGFEKVTEVSLPESLRSIGWNAFRACCSLRSVVFGREIEHIYPRAFIDCTSLAEITFLCCPEMENSVFENVTATVYYIPEMWTEFPVFTRANLTWVPYGDEHPFGSVSECTPACSAGDGFLGQIVCLDCGVELYPATALLSGKILSTDGGISTLTPDSLEWGDAQQLVITTNVTAISSRAFADAEALRLIMVPDSVVSIADDAFAGAEDAVVYCYAGSYCESWLKMHAVSVSYVAKRPAMQLGFLTPDGQTLYPVNGNIICPDTQWAVSFTAGHLNSCIGHDDLVWSSSDENVARVDAQTGRIAYGSSGEAVLTCRIMDNLELTAAVTVTDVRPTGMSLPQTELVLYGLQGDVFDLPAPVFDPEGSLDAVAMYCPGSLGTLTEDGRFICADVVGSTDIIYTSACGFTASCWVKNEPILQIRYDETAELWVGLPDGRNSTLQLECVLMAPIENVTYEWYAVSEIISIDENGLVTACSSGDVWLVVTAYDSEGRWICESDHVNLHINSAMNIVGVQSQMYMSEPPLVLNLDVEYCLEDIPRSDVTWSLRFEEGDNNAVINADGLLTVNWPSTFVVRAETPEGYWAEKHIHVMQGMTEVVSGGTFEIPYGESARLHLFTIYPDDIQSFTYRITVSDPEILAWNGVVDVVNDEEYGEKIYFSLTGAFAGEAEVTFHELRMGLSASATVKVTTDPCQTHTPTVQAAIEATCTEAGRTAWSYCPTCGVILEASEVVPALGHVWTTDRLTAATQTEDGCIGWIFCAACGEERRPETIISRECVLWLPAGLTHVESYAFQRTNAQQVVVPSGTETIGPYAFANCGLLSLVVLPDSLTEIADDAFAESMVLIIAPAGSYAAQWAEAHGCLYAEP